MAAVARLRAALVAEHVHDDGVVGKSRFGIPDAFCRVDRDGGRRADEADHEERAELVHAVLSFPAQMDGPGPAPMTGVALGGSKKQTGGDHKKTADTGWK